MTQDTFVEEKVRILRGQLLVSHSKEKQLLTTALQEALAQGRKDTLNEVLAVVEGKMEDVPDGACYKSWTPQEVVEADFRNETLTDITEAIKKL